MTAKDRLLKNLNSIIRKDAYINELLKSAGMKIDDLESLLQDIYSQRFFDTMTWGADLLARQMNIVFNPSLIQAEKNSLIEARFKSSGKADVDLLQAVADSWKNGNVEISFINGKFTVEFIGEYGIPSDLSGLKNAIDEAKPCHLIVDYLFKYFLINDIHEKMTIAELETMTLNKFAFGGEN